MKMEGRVEEDALEARFKDLVFANNPDLYKALFGSEVTDEDQQDDSFNWIVPQTEQEAMELLREAQSGAFG